MAVEDSKKIGSASGVMLDGRIEIFPSMPLPELNTAGGMAYAARFKTDATSSLYAIVCQSKIPPRIDYIQAMRGMDNPGILRFIDGGVVQWVDGSLAYVLVYQRPTAPRMFATLDETRPVLNEDSVNRYFVAPMVGALTVFSNMGFVHNAIRPTNIFWRTGTSVAPQIGEGLSVPAGFDQPVVFEPVSRALSMPLGKGVGTHADDCYAFGVSLAFLLLGGNPMRGLTDQQIIEMKMQRGSFAAIVGHHRISPTHIEILRGLLADDWTQRWTSSDLDQWLGGRRMTLKSSDAGKKAARHFVFMGQEYWQIAPLADAFARNVSEATKVIENESLTKWLLRALDDKDRADDIDSVMNDLKQSGKTGSYEDQLVARVCMVLDHTAPIRYRGLSTMPSGIPTLLVEANLNQNTASTQALSEMITTQMVSLWIQLQGENKAPYIPLGQMFDRMRLVLEKASYGNGIEHVIYEMNSGIPCLSPMLRNQYVLSPKGLLPALERVAATGNKPPEPMDRHIAAFIVVRDRRGDRVFLPLSIPPSEESVVRGTALLTIFSELQYKYGPESLPHLAAWLSPIVEPALRRFFNKNLREAMHKRAKELVSAGKISALAQMIDDPQKLDKDQKDFLAARILFLNIQKEIINLESRAKNRDAVVSSSGRPTAVTLSFFLAIILVCAALLRAMFIALFL